MAYMKSSGLILGAVIGGSAILCLIEAYWIWVGGKEQGQWLSS